MEGPPGTGKSQTIVNIVGEAIGRGESVLVICQKQAALQVVQKRLDAEGLGGRLFSVTEVNRDRDAIVRALREQLPAARATDPGALAALRRRREDRPPGSRRWRARSTADTRPCTRETAPGRATGPCWAS